MPRSKFPRPLSGRQFSGILNEPMRPPNALVIGLLTKATSDEMRKQVYALLEADFQRQYEERISALAEHYGISNQPDVTRKLLFRLAKDFIIGFNDASEVGNVTAGRKKGQTKGDVFELWKASKELELSRHLTRLSACTHISKQRGTPWYGRSPRALAEQIRRFNKTLGSHGRQSDDWLIDEVKRIVRSYKKSRTS